MCRRACLAVLFLAGPCWLAASQPVLAAPGENPGKRAELRQRVIQKFDKNGNGQLDPDEKEAAKAAMQKRREQGGGVARARGERAGLIRNDARNSSRSSTRTATASSARPRKQWPKRPGLNGASSQ